MCKFVKGISSEKALALFRNLPKITQTNVTLNKGAVKKIPHAKKRGQHGHSPRGAMQALAYKYLGYEGASTPFHTRVPNELSFNFGYQFHREYPPFSLYQIQLAIDSGRLDPCKKIDLLSLLGAKLIKFNQPNYYGVHLTDNGLDLFTAKINIEVQWASEQVIAAIEKVGGNIVTAYYDPLSISILKNPLKFFSQGKPLPRRLYPPKDIINYYIDPANRGYLTPFLNDIDCKSKEGNNFSNSSSLMLWKKKLETAQKFGYDLYYCPDGDESLKIKLNLDNISNFWSNCQEFPPFPSDLYTLKSPINIFEGLQPGSVINLADQVVLKPDENEWNEYYQAKYMS